MNISRYFGPDILPLGKMSKIPKIESKDYREWVKGLPCLVSGEFGVDPHHLQRKAQGINDYTCVPLTRLKHSEYHHIGHLSFQKKYEIDLRDSLIETLTKALLNLDGIEYDSSVDLKDALIAKLCERVKALEAEQLAE